MDFRSCDRVGRSVFDSRKILIFSNELCFLQIPMWVCGKQQIENRKALETNSVFAFSEIHPQKTE